ncbi:MULTISPECIES: transporter [unclassified Clostridium]|uniref:transporter n=1 Tax=unclassified Clostridium TaxID=2614128 RepID=UPI00029776EE|nr:MULTISPECIES: transporter [unclassified Clostridium]EKQ53630.1 MAG: EamA-like transporter family [Clostridium sp. Maddingley MBC34-26]
MMYLLLFINIIMLVLGQVLWKIGVGKSSFNLSIQGIINMFFNPYILGGGIIYVFATIIWIYILSKEELSRVYPLQSLCYVIGILAGVLIFKECFTLNKGLGAVFIIIGTLIITR